MVDSEMWHLLSGAVHIVHVQQHLVRKSPRVKKAGNVILEALSLSKTLAPKVKAADVVLEPLSPSETLARLPKSSRRDFGSLVKSSLFSTVSGPCQSEIWHFQ